MSRSSDRSDDRRIAAPADDLDRSPASEGHTQTATSGNAHVRKGGYVGQAISFDLTTAKIAGVDTNGDQTVDISDVTDGDKVLVQARIAKGTEYAAPAEGEPAAAIVARKLVDRTGTAEDAE